MKAHTFLLKQFSRQTLFVLFVIGIVFAMSLQVIAAPNQQINYQGKLVTATNVAVANGTYLMQFNLYAASSSGAALWTETRSGVNRVTVTNGLFSVMLGSVTSLSGVNFDQTLYLGVTIEADAEMAPRKILGTVPAAFEANNAATVGGVASTSLVRNDQATTITASTSASLFSIIQNGTGDIFNLFDGGTKVFTVLDGGNIGIGTSTPAARLHILGTNQQFRTGFDAANYLSITTGPTGTTTFNATGTSPAILFTDNQFELADDTDPTKRMGFQLSGITTGTKSLWTFPSGTATFVGTALTQTLSNKTISAGTFTGASLFTGTSTFATTTMASSTITDLTLINALALTSGGTGATTAAGARTNLGATTVGANIFTLTNPSALSFLRINADNTVSAVATSTLGIALSDTTGILAATRGGTGLSSYATGDLIYASGANTLANRTIGTTGQVLQVVAGVPAWVATSSLGITGGITAFGPLGQTQSGPTITQATSTGSFNGLTSALTIVGSGNTLTYTPTLSGTLNNAGITTPFLSFATTSTGSDISFTSASTTLGATAILNIPNASASARGVLTIGDWSLFNNKISSSSLDTSAKLAALLTDETGTGALVFAGSPLFTGTAGFVNLTATGTLAVSGTSTFATTTIASSTIANLNVTNNTRIIGGANIDTLTFASSYGSIISALVGSSTGFTNFSGGIGTGGTDSIASAYNNALRITNTGNLVNIGSVQGGELNLTRGGTFAAKVDYTTGLFPIHTTIGDVNGDGKADIVTANYNAASASVLINNGSGTFATKVDYTTGSSPAGIALGDINGDGRADMVTANYTNTSASVFINNGSGTFATKVDYITGSSPVGIALADVNGDSKADMIVGNSGPGSVSVFLNIGNGNFATKADYTVGSNTQYIALGDVNGDGKADIMAANFNSANVSVLINNGNGTFATKVDYTTGANPYGIALGDVNGDNRSDIVVSNNASSTASVLINNGNGTFATKVDYTTGANPRSIALGDVSGDGKADIVVANNGAITAGVLINNGDGTFATRVDYATANNSFGIALGDINGDGKADMVATNGTSASVSVFFNNALSTLYAQSSTGNVGIGTSTPNSRLLVTGNSGSVQDIFSVASSTNVKLFAVSSDGNVGIGATSTAFKLTVGGSGYFAGNLIATGTLAISGTSTLSTTTISSSTITTLNLLNALAGTSGGTGLSTITQNQLLIGGAGNTWSQVATSSLGLSAAFASSSQLAALLTDETGSGSAVFSASPTFTGTVVFPSSIQMSGTFFTRSGNHNLVLTTTANTNVTLPATGTLYGTATSSITSANLLSSISDKTGTGTIVFSESPLFTGTAGFVNLTATGTLAISGTSAFTGTSTFATTTMASSTITDLTLINALALSSGGTGATTAAGARTNLGATTVGSNIFTLTNPSALSFLRINADNTVSAVATSTLGIALSDTTGILAATRGGTGLSTITQNQLLIGGAGNTWSQVATSSLGLSASFTTSAQLAALLSDETGTGAVVFAGSPLFTGTAGFVNVTATGTLAVSGTSTFATTTQSGNLTLSGSSANIILGANYLSGDGDDEGVFVTGAGNVGIGTTTPGAKLSVAASGTYGAELVTNGTFTGTSSGWTLVAGCSTYNANQVTVTYNATCQAGNNKPLASTTFSTVAGTVYSLSFTVSALTNDYPFVYLDNGTINDSLDSSTAGTYVFNFVGGITGLETITFESSLYTSNGTWTIDDVSIKQITAAPTLNITGYDNTSWLSLGGNLFSNIGLGKAAMSANTTGYQNTFLGEAAGSFNTTGNRNVATGFKSLYRNTTGNENIATGAFSLNSNTLGSQNVAVGNNALFSNDGGMSNIAIGKNALYKNLSGGDNVAVGWQSLANSTGNFNTALGSGSLMTNTTGSSNTVLGVSAAFANTVGNENIAIGNYAMRLNTSGSHNSVLGYYGLDANNGTGTIAIGYYAADNALSVDRGIFIGYDIDAASTTQDDVLNIGNLIFGNNVNGTGTAISTGNIGIGSTSPSSKLTVAGSGFFAGNLTATGTLAISGTSAFTGTSTFATTTMASSTITTLNLINALALTSGGTGANNAAGARTNLGATTVGANIFTLANPSALSFLRINADNTVSAVATSTLGIALSDTTGILAATRGGTGLSSYATGDLLYASGANTLANRTIGTTGDVLSVVSGVPTWVATSTLGMSAALFTDGGATTYLTSLTDNLAIGTTTANQALTIFRDAADAAIEFSTVSGALEKWTIGIDDSDSAKFKISSSSVLGTNDRFVINGTGFVGIGDSAPSEEVHMRFDQNGESNFYAENNTNGGAAVASFKARANGSSLGAQFGMSAVGNTFSSGAMADRAFIYSHSDMSGINLYNAAAAPIIFTIDDVEAGRFASTSNFGLGTTTPTAKLTVVGDSLITGTSTFSTTTIASSTITTLNLINALALTSGGTGATTAAGARTNLGATTVGSNIFTLTNPSALSFLRINADNTVSAVATSTLGIALSDTTGILAATRGGTGLSSYATGDLIYASGANTLANRTIGTTGDVLSVVAGVPTWVATSTLGITGGGSSLFTDGGASTYLTSLTDNLAVGTTTGTAKLTVVGDGFFGGNLTATGTFAVSGTSTLATTTATNLSFTNNFSGPSISANATFGVTLSNALNMAFNNINNVTNLGVTGTSTLATTTIASSTITTLNLVNALALTSGGTGASTAAGARTNLGATTIGSNIFTLTNPSALSFLRINADNTVSAVATSTLGIALSDTTGILSAIRGGTGLSLYATGDLIYASGANTLANRTIGTAGQLLQVVGGVPTWSSTSTLGIAISDTTGTLDVNRGGTGAVTLTGLLQGNGTGAVTAIAGTAGQFAYYNGANTLAATSSIFLATNGNFGVGTTSPNSKLTVAGGINIDNGSSGLSILGNRVLYASSTNESTILGLNAGRLMTSSASQNTAIGFGAMEFSTSSIVSTAIGYAALQSNTSGGYNTAVGASAMISNTTGSFNTAYGNSSLYSNVSGSANTAIGYTALALNTIGSNNIAIGNSAMYDNASGTQNIAIGVGAGTGLINNQFEGRNTFLGYGTGLGITTGINNTIIGANVTGLSATLANNIILADGQGNQRINVGSTGNVGIGSTTPSAKLTVGGAGYFGGNLTATGTLTISGTSTLATTSIAGLLQMGTTSVASRFNLDVGNFATAGTAGLNRYYTSTNAASGTVQFGELGYVRIGATATTTMVGSMFRVEDSTTFANTIRGFEVQTNRGTNTRGENTALSGFARTFGVRGFTSADAGGVFEPAGGYFETGGTTQGNAIRGYSSTITSASLASLFQDTSAFTGNGLIMNLGNGTGSFTGKFMDLQVAGATKFNVASTGTLFTLGDISLNATNTDPAANNVVGMYLGASGFASINRTANPAMNLGRTTDGAVLQFYSAGAVQGSVSIAGATVSYNAFTGSHFGLTNGIVYPMGTLLALTGENKSYNNNTESEILYGMTESTTENSPLVIGSYLSVLEPVTPESVTNPTLVMAVGNGAMWVADQGANITRGDYLISSNVAGHAERDAQTEQVSNVIARASEDIDWSSVTEEINGVKHKRITVFFETFTRTNINLALIASSTVELADIDSDSVTGNFMTGLFGKLTEWFSSAQNGIGDMYANVFNANERICVDGECLTADDIRNLKDAIGAPPTPTLTPAPTSGGSSSGEGSGAGAPVGTGTQETVTEAPAEIPTAATSGSSANTTESVTADPLPQQPAPPPAVAPEPIVGSEPPAASTAGV